MLRVVGVQAALLQLAPVERVMVGVDRGLTARPAVPALGGGADAARVAGKDLGPELLLVPASVATPPCAAAPLLGLAPAPRAPPALGVLGAAGGRADAPALGLGHAASATVSGLEGVVALKKVDVPLGIVVAGVVLIVGCRLITWWPGVIVGAALILGVLASAAMQRRGKG